MTSAFLIEEFDIWRPGYGGTPVTIYKAGTTNLADVFTDEALTTTAANPQTLLSRSDDDGVNYGKFETSLYTQDAYQLQISSSEETGTQRPPITTLTGADASLAEVKPDGSAISIPFNILAKRVIFAENYGIITPGDSASSATNTATINLAVAALDNGGEVYLPAGRIRVTSLSVPEGVVLVGTGDESTYIESVVGDKVFTITGNRAGFRRLTLDGMTLPSGSIGVYSVGHDEVVMDEVTIQRFETNAIIKGGNGHRWRAFKDVNSVNGVKLLGDTDAANGHLGGPIQDIVWLGGLVKQNSTTGVLASYEDALCQNILYIAVGFEDNTGTAEKYNGAQLIQHIGCWWTGNTVNWDILDDTDALTPATSANNDVIGVRAQGGRMSGGIVKVKNTAQDVVLDTVKLDNVAFNIQTPVSNAVYLRSCTENGVSVTGETTKLIRAHETDRGQSFGVTTSNVQTKAWSMPLEPGQSVDLTIKAIGKQRNGIDRASYVLHAHVYRLGASLAYDTQSANFTLGDVLTGATSGATARIVADSDSGTTGTLTLTDIVGTFLDNEVITGSTTGSALANGTTSGGVVTVGGQTMASAYESDAAWNVVAVANGPEIEVQVLGAASKTIEWTVDVDVVTT